MIVTDIRIQAKSDQDKGPLFPEISPKQNGKIIKMGILEAGMASGKTSVALIMEMDDGTHIAAETSAAIFLGMAAAVRGACQRFGDEQ